MVNKKAGSEGKLIRWFDELKKGDTAIVGGKCANLGELLRADIPVPAGFAITALAYEDFITSSGIAPKIYGTIKEIVTDESKPRLYEMASEKIRKLIEDTPIPKNTEKAIRKAYRDLSSKFGRDVYVAVRSSATAEDLPGASFAGQQDTFLNVKGEDELLDTTKKCWSSLFTPRAIFYRTEKGFRHESVLISVAVQRMVDAKCAGVMFTLHPVTGDPSKIVIEGNWGLGETVVSGSVTPDEYVVDKNTLNVESRRIATKSIQRVRDPKTGKTVEISVPKELQNDPCLNDEEIKRLGELGKAIEEHYGAPQDVEWAIEKDVEFPKSVQIVQSRPETVWAPKPMEEREVPTKPTPIPAPTPSPTTIPHRQAEESRIIVVKGFPASPGLAFGKARIGFSPDDIAKIFEEGDLIVTKMTNPDWAPYMRVASGIITEEGGMTCFSGDTKLLTDRGFMRFEEVYEVINGGEQLSVLSFGLREMKTEWKKITAAMRRRASLIRVAISQTGRARKNTLDLTPDHKLLSVNGRRLVYEGVTDILNDGKMVCVAHKIPSLPTQLDPSADEAYVLGAVISDGNIELTRTHGQTYFIQKPLPEKILFIDSVKGAFRRAYGHELKGNPKKPSTGFLRGGPVRGAATAYYCARKDVAKRLQGLKENLQEWVLNADEETLTSFLASLVDGDGSMPKKSPRLHLFIGEGVLQATVVALLRLGILPQVTANRSIYNVQLVEKLDKILSKTKRVKPGGAKRALGSSFFSARQLLQDIIEQVNHKGRVRPYVDKNLLIGADKIQKYVLPVADENAKHELQKILNADFRMQRIVKIVDLGENDVYNIEVEDNHNYVVFTKRYTPLIVRNCHAAIVSRELGIPCIVGAPNATKVMETGRDYTLDAKTGVVYEGLLEELRQEAMKPDVSEAVATPMVITSTKIYVNLSLPEVAEKVFKESRPDGVGLLRAEHLMLSVGKHPRLLIEEGGAQRMIDTFAGGIRKVAEVFAPGPVVYRFLDFKPDEFLSLPGGEKYEVETGHVGPNPLIGYRGCFRYTKEPDVFRLECRAIRKVREEYGLKNVWVMLPFVRTLREFRAAKKIMEEEGLMRGIDFKLWIMVEVPSSGILIDKFIEEGIDGVSFGTNDYTMLILGLDRNDAAVQELYDERDLAVLRLVSHVIRICNEHGVTTSICGQAPSNYPEYLEFLIREGATSISVNPDVVNRTRLMVASIEQKLLLEGLRQTHRRAPENEPLFQPKWSEGLR